MAEKVYKVISSLNSEEGGTDCPSDPPPSSERCDTKDVITKVDSSNYATLIVESLPQMTGNPILRLQKARQLRLILEDQYFSRVARDELLTTEGAVSESICQGIPTLMEALQVAVDPTTPSEARLELLSALGPSPPPSEPGKQRALHRSSKPRLTRALHRNGYACEMCPSLLAQPDISEDEQGAAISLFGAECDPADNESRDDTIAEMCSSLANAQPDVAAKNSHLLAALAGRRKEPWVVNLSICSDAAYTKFHSNGGLGVIQRKVDCLPSLFNALKSAAGQQAFDLAVVVAFLASEEAEDSESGLLLGAVPALRDLLTDTVGKAAAAEALYFISATDRGQEAILANEVVPALGKSVLEPDGAAALTAGRVLGRLCFQKDARQALFAALSSSTNKEKASLVLAHACIEKQICCLACEKEGIRTSTLLQQPGPDASLKTILPVLSMIGAIAHNGTPNQRKHLLDARAVDCVLAAIGGDPGNWAAWYAIGSIIKRVANKQLRMVWQTCSLPA